MIIKTHSATTLAVAAFALLTIVAGTACNKPEFKANQNGLIYKIIPAATPGRQIQVNDIVTMHYTYMTTRDSVLYTTTLENPEPMPSKVLGPKYKGDFQEGVMMMHAGDSGIFLSNAAEFFKAMQQDLPKYFNKNDTLKMCVKIYTAQTEDDFIKNLAANESKELKAYIATNHITTAPDASGLYVIHTKEGTGSMPQPGDTAVVHYTGKLLNGKIFDSSLSRGEPLSFPLGANAAIEGWENGIMQMKEGGSATLIVPSTLGYGAQGQGPIPPYSTLVFEVTMIGVKKGLTPLTKK